MHPQEHLWVYPVPTCGWLDLGTPRTSQVGLVQNPSLRMLVVWVPARRQHYKGLRSIVGPAPQSRPMGYGAAADQAEVSPDSNPSAKTKLGVPSIVPQAPPIQR